VGRSRTFENSVNHHLEVSMPGSSLLARKRSIFSFCFTVLLCLGLASAARAQSFDIIPVGDGTYAAIGRPGIASNGAFIINQDDVVVVDTHYRPSWARDLIAEIRKLTNKPVRYVVDTHWHNDHVQGNQSYVAVFGPNVEYLAQHNTREDIVKKAIPSVQQSLATDVPNLIARIQKALDDGKDLQGNPLTADTRKALETRLADQKSYLEELKQIQITLPTLTFDRSLILHKPNRAIHVYYFGKGHTRGDVVVYLPAEKVLITGDLVTNGIPFMRDAYPVEWAVTLESLEKLDWNKAVCGHGPVQEGKGQLQNLIAYMRDMVAGVKDAVAKGMTLEQAKSSIDLSKYSTKFQAYTTPAAFKAASDSAIDRTWAEVTGKIPD
jgi:glyoxylase-like metal-dependent hydrolase (beta-lactamase superfamily II)